jgi:hypothetical protein
LHTQDVPSNEALSSKQVEQSLDEVHSLHPVGQARQLEEPLEIEEKYPFLQTHSSLTTSLFES